MNRFYRLAIATMFSSTLTVWTQQIPNPSNAEKDKRSQQTTRGGLPTAEQQLKVLTEKIDLTSDQQARVKPIVQELHDTIEKTSQDKTLSREERMSKVRPELYKLDRVMREILSEDQKKKLDLYEQGPHAEMHGDLNGAEPTSPRSQ